MHKIMKRSLALLLAVVLCFSAMPLSAFATEIVPDEALTSEVPPSEAPAESEQPDVTPVPEPTATPASSPDTAEGQDEQNGNPAAEPDTGSDDPELTPGTELDVDRIWPVIQRKARSAAAYGTSGTLYVGDYCFSSEIGVPPTLGEWIGPMPIETMRYGSNNVAAYCIEHAKESGDGMGYTWMDLSTNNQETLGTILALGFQWNSPTVWAVPSDNCDKWIVTQVLIWETIAGNAFVQGNGLIGIKPGVDDDMQMISAHAYNPTKFMQYYRDLKQKLNDYLKVPSFASKNPGTAETITLRWDGSKYSATVTDSNSVLDNYDFAGTVPGVKITANGNSMTLSATEPILTAKTSSEVTSYSGAAGGKGAVAVWRTSDRSFQDFATYNAGGGDPVSCFIKVKTDAVGNAGLKKTSEDGKVDGIQFQITGSDGSSMTKATDADGNIDMEGMPIYAADGSKITYTATEINVPNKYVKPESQTFQLTEGQTASIHFENKLKRWRVTVTKADVKTGSSAQGNGSLKGAVFGVYQGGTLVKEYTVGDDLTFTTDYYPYGEDWTLKEISAGEGYKVSTVVTDLCEIPAGSNEEFNDNPCFFT